MDSICSQIMVELLNLVSCFDLLDRSLIFERLSEFWILNHSSHIRHTLNSIPQYREAFDMSPIQSKL
jgi:hypothetical protein